MSRYILLQEFLAQRSSGYVIRWLSRVMCCSNLPSLVQIDEGAIAGLVRISRLEVSEVFLQVRKNLKALRSSQEQHAVLDSFGLVDC